MEELNQYIKPSIIGILIIRVAISIISGLFRWANDELALIVIAIILATLEIWLIIRIFKGIYLYVKRKDAETQELKENQEYMMKLLRAQRTEE